MYGLFNNLPKDVNQCFVCSGSGLSFSCEIIYRYSTQIIAKKGEKKRELSMQTSFQAWPKTKPQVNQFRNAETNITVICLPSSPLFLPVAWLSLNSWPRCNSRMNPNGLAQKMVECPYDEMHCARANCKKQKPTKRNK